MQYLVLAVSFCLMVVAAVKFDQTKTYQSESYANAQRQYLSQTTSTPQTQHANQPKTNGKIHFVYDEQGNLVGEYDKSGNMLREYIFIGDMLVGMFTSERPNQLLQVHTDHLGTPRAVTDKNKDVLWRWEGDAFGDMKPQIEKIELPLRMKGQYYDKETELAYNGARYYDPSTGRYNRPDPKGLQGGTNTYNYVNANPLHDTDSTGELPDSLTNACARSPKLCASLGRSPKTPVKSPKKSPIKPNKRKGMWNCAVVACCNDNIPNNCPDDPKQWCKQAVWRSAMRSDAINTAERLAKIRLGCQPKHVTVRCTGPKGQNYQRGGK